MQICITLDRQRRKRGMNNKLGTHRHVELFGHSFGARGMATPIWGFACLAAWFSSSASWQITVLCFGSAAFSGWGAFLGHAEWPRQYGDLHVSWSRNPEKTTWQITVLACDILTVFVPPLLATPIMGIAHRKKKTTPPGCARNRVPGGGVGGVGIKKQIYTPYTLRKQRVGELTQNIEKCSGRVVSNSPTLRFGG